MALELLNRIRAAEKDAEDKRAEALHDGREMVKAVEDACREAERENARGASALYQQGMEKWRAQTEKSIQDSNPAWEKELQGIISRAEENLPAAARLIAERIVSDGHC